MDQSCTKLSNTYYGLEKYELQGLNFAKKGKMAFDYPTVCRRLSHRCPHFSAAETSTLTLRFRQWHIAVVMKSRRHAAFRLHW
jgi:hypothetical protein